LAKNGAAKLCSQVLTPSIGVEALDSQPDLHLGEEMVIAWCQVRTVRRVVENLPVERAAVWTARCRAGERRL